MKPRKIEFEGPFIDERGYRHTDTGDTWHLYMPREFWTSEARELFKAAAAAGIISWCDKDDAGIYISDPYYTANIRSEKNGSNGVTKPQFAYWCKLASTYLGLDRGGTTNWRPFEKVFNNEENANPLKACLWCLKDQPYYKKETNAAGYRLDQVEAIDNFFESLNLNKENNTNK